MWEWPGNEPSLKYKEGLVVVILYTEYMWTERWVRTVVTRSTLFTVTTSAVGGNVPCEVTHVSQLLIIKHKCTHAYTHVSPQEGY